MEILLDAAIALVALACVMLLGYGAWLCLSQRFQRDPKEVQRERSEDAPAPTSLRKRVRSLSERLSASNR